MRFRSRGIIASLLVLSVLASGTMFAFSATAAHGPPVDSWTVALYVAVDNNLEDAWDHYSIPSLSAIPYSKDVNVVAMVDRLSTNDLESIEMIQFTGGAYEVVATYPEMNTGDDETFAFFIDEVAAKFPSENLCVIPWDHGGSWRGFCSDETSGKDLITMEEFSTALTVAGEHVDVMAFDACVMSSTEVVYEAAAITGMVDYIIACEMYVPYDSFPYEEMLTPLVENPDATSEELCAMMLSGWEAYYHRGRQLNLVTVDVAVIGDALPAFKAWAGALSEGLETYGSLYTAALDDTISNTYVGYNVDLYDFCEQLLAVVSEPAIVSTTEAVMSVVDEAVVGLTTSGWATDMHGLSIWWASDDYLSYLDKYIEQVQFAEDADWGELQTAFVT